MFLRYQENIPRQSSVALAVFAMLAMLLKLIGLVRGIRAL